MIAVFVLRWESFPYQSIYFCPSTWMPPDSPNVSLCRIVDISSQISSGLAGSQILMNVFGENQIYLCRKMEFTKGRPLLSACDWKQYSALQRVQQTEWFRSGQCPFSVLLAECDLRLRLQQFSIGKRDVFSRLDGREQMVSNLTKRLISGSRSDQTIVPSQLG